LIKNNKQYYRAYNNIDIINISINFENISFKIDEKFISSDDIESVWFRKGGVNIVELANDIKTDDNADFTAAINQNHKQESKFLIEFICILLEKKKKLGTFHRYAYNKLNVLRLANSAGLKIPLSSVISNKKELIDNCRFNKSIISKSISESFSYISDIQIIKSFTEIVDISNLPIKFASSLVQECIDKEYEVRSFYINKKFYSMAVFTIENLDETIDIRKNSIKKIHVPYSLPKNYEDKLRQLMTLLKLDTASIDIIKSKDGNLYFLEANPAGIFDDVSYYCNYYIEKLIADYF